MEINKLLVPSPSVEVLNSNGDIVAYRQPDIGFLQGIFKSFGDAPDGFAEENSLALAGATDSPPHAS